jgi:beta-lactamase regulating signal transducer with metallopeptidase domain
MNAWLHTLAGHVQQSLYPAGLLEVLLESVVVLLVATATCLLWRRAAAATRHLIWFAGLASLPVLLCLAVWPHTWPKPLWSVSKELNSGNQVSVMLTLLPPANPADSFRVGTPDSSTSSHSPRALASQPLAARLAGGWLTFVLNCWAGGGALALIWLAVGQLRLRQLARHSTPVDTPEWRSLVRTTCLTLGLHRPVTLLQGDESVMPVTWGWRQPVILLPTEAADWPLERRRLVLLHELAHVKRWDCLTQTVARVVGALFWVNPLVWLAARRMCVERERACDDLVLQSDCKVSDYAAELLAIARAFRPARHAAGIAMARSAHLQGRIAAMIDPRRARRMRPRAVAEIIVCVSTLVACVAGTSGPSLLGANDSTALRQEQLTQLESFAAAKQKQSQAFAAKDGQGVSPEYERCLEAAVKGDVGTVTNLYEFFKQNHGQYSRHTNGIALPHTPRWQPVLEACLAYDHLANCEPKITKLVLDGIINSIPPGSIYFGGTDPGRGLPTAFEKSSIDGDPFFCLTQNALADGSYLDYLQAMYGGKIYTPTQEDSQRCFNDYLKDAQRRLQHDQQFPNAPKQLKPGEDVRQEGTSVYVAGQVAVMSINGLLTKTIFDRNPEREFYVEESFPLDWMYPHLEPQGVIMKLNRQPLAELPEDVLARDRDYWRQVMAKTVGNMLDDETSVADLVASVERVYVRHDLEGFTGDPAFIENHYAKAMLSKLRSSIAGIYAWRLATNSPAEYRPHTDAAAQRLEQQTDLAFRQGFALCPYSPEAVFRYVNFLVQLHRIEDARLVAQTALDVGVKNNLRERQFKDQAQSQFKDLLRSLQKMQGP